MIIKDFKVEEIGERIKASVMIRSHHYGEEELWFSLPNKYDGYICKDQMDGFLVGMLYPAMHYGENIYIDGRISEKLIFNLNNYVIPLLLSFSESLKKIKVTARETSIRRFNGEGVGMGFSAGIDSFCTFYDRHVLEGMPAYKINSLLFFNVGSHGDWLHTESTEYTKNKFRTRYLEIKKFTDEINIDFIDIDSNLHFYHHWWHSNSHSLKAASAILLLQRYYSKYYYPSAGLDYAGTLSFSENYRNFDIGAYCDPILLPLLSTESLDFISDGCAYTRSQKLLHILNYEPVSRYLNVCVGDVDQWANCSTCGKCLRTLLTLDITDNLNKFYKIFDVNKYKGKRDSYIKSQIEEAATDPFASDNINLAKKLGFKLPSIRYVLLQRRLRDIARLPVRIVKLPIEVARKIIKMI